MKLVRSVIDGLSLHATAISPALFRCVSDEHQMIASSSPAPASALARRNPAEEDPWRNIYLIGLGAIGTAYLAPLYDLQPDAVRVIVDPKGRALLEVEPMQVNGRAYRFPMICPGEVREPASLLLISVKAGQLDEALALASEFIEDDDTVVVCLMNGLPPVDALSRYFELNRILIGVIYTHATRVGHMVESRNQGKLILGALSTSFSREQLDSLQHLFARAGIRTEVAADIHRATWEKYLINVALNQVSGVLRATYGQLSSSRHACKLLLEVAEELLELARACGIVLTYRAPKNIFKLLASLPPEGKTSMLQDLVAGRRTEVDAFAGDVIRLGQEHGVSTPRNRMLLHMLRFLERQGAPPPELPS